MFKKVTTRMDKRREQGRTDIRSKYFNSQRDADRHDALRREIKEDMASIDKMIDEAKADLERKIEASKQQEKVEEKKSDLSPTTERYLKRLLKADSLSDSNVTLSPESKKLIENTLSL